MKDKDSPWSPADDKAGSGSGGRREPVFTDFDEDEDYEESERDTDYASAFEEELEDEDYPEPVDEEDPEPVETDWQVLGTVEDISVRRSSRSGNPWDVVEQVGDEPEDADDDLDDDEYDDVEEPYDEAPYDEESLSDEESEEDWGDTDDPREESHDYHLEPDEGTHSWPLGLVIVGVTALILLAAGGYGVVQQRAATQDEIRQLQARLATAASPDELAAGKEALRDMEARNVKYQATIDTLTMENRRLTDMVTGLEKQLVAQQAALSGPTSTGTKTPKPAAAKPKTQAVTKPASTSSGGDWFVNFSSYGQRSVADNWARKLKPAAGKAIVTPGEKDGKTFYRVRIVGLASRAQAQEVAGKLQETYGLPPLWVGTD